jgi:hypothetical protein
MEEQTRIVVRMNSQVKSRGLLERIEIADLEAVVEMQKLVENNCFRVERLPLIFGVAAKCAMERKSEVEQAPYSARASIEKTRMETHMLATTCACKMSLLYPQYLKSLHESFLFAMQHAEKVELRDIEDLTVAQMVLIGLDIVKNGKLIEIAEGVADGLGNTHDMYKRQAILKLGTALFKALDGNEDGDLAKTYNAIFNLVVNPTKSKDSMYVTFLRKRLSLIEREDSNMKRIFGEVTVRRMKKTISPKPEVVYEQPPLPEAHIGKSQPRQKRSLGQMARDLLHIKPKKGNRVAFAGRRT